MFAIKEIDERLARREHRLLRRLQELGVPAVEVLGVVADRPGLEAALVTRFLEFSTPYRNLFANPRGVALTDRLLDALVELLVRLHLAGFLWGDCSLSNTLFRHDAGAFAAYLVDAETAELRPTLSDGHARVRREPGLRAGRRRALRPAGRRAARRRRRPDRGGRAGPAPVRGAVGGAGPGGAAAAGRPALPDRRAAAPAQRARLRRRRAGHRAGSGRATACGYGPGSPSRGSTGSCCSPGPASTPRRTRPAGCSTTSPASAAGWSRPRAGGWRRPRRPTAGSPRCTTR